MRAHCVVQDEMWRWFSVCLLVVHAIGIAIFSRGFLLTRSELPFFSHPGDAFFSSCTASNGSSSWPQPSVNRLVIIVLDALRFDFVAPSEFFPDQKRWMDKLTVLQEAVLSSSASGQHSAKIFKAIADPPTTSLQRLKALTTGGLPTFIDIGNSFGASAIVEDNFILQLVRNGKRVVMMGDDTWVQLFPNHFNQSYPYPSFNVKDLNTVDNGCIEHLFPSLLQDDWDVLIAHFLGVDHAGHIYGVDSLPMVEKLEQYNLILENVIKVLESESRPGGMHQNTLLLVMGDHGQTLNGDHGGGSNEEVETSLFAMRFNKRPVPSFFDDSSCRLIRGGKHFCISTIHQLNFAVTVSSLLGIPFPFGSIGHVDHELYALAAGIKDGSSNISIDHEIKEAWVLDYANVLCVNSWQVKRYVETYSNSAIVGFPSEDMLHLTELYARAEESWSQSKAAMECRNDSCEPVLPIIKRQFDAYFSFLSAVVELARAKWTEFDINLMILGLGFMVLSIFFSLIALQSVGNKLNVFKLREAGFSSDLVLPVVVIAVRSISFLSNSYILEEGKVASFLLATCIIAKLRMAVMLKKMVFEAFLLLVVNLVLRLLIEVGLSKQAATSMFLNASSSWMLGISRSNPVEAFIIHMGPTFCLLSLSWLLYRSLYPLCSSKVWKYLMMGTLTSYFLIMAHWVLESLDIPIELQSIGTIHLPRIIYSIGLLQLFCILTLRIFGTAKLLKDEKAIGKNVLVMLSIWSPTVIIISGKQGTWIALLSVIGGYCIAKLGTIADVTNETGGMWLAVAQWNLFAVCLFFASGHWCAFDGLRYGAAFIGFDEFKLARQAILLAIDTFGFSHILPIFALPLITVCQTSEKLTSAIQHLPLVFISYGLISSTATTFSILSVAIQRRHLMVWGLFAPKFVFDVVSITITDCLIIFASLLYSTKLFNQKIRSRTISASCHSSP